MGGIFSNEIQRIIPLEVADQRLGKNYGRLKAAFYKIFINGTVGFAEFRTHILGQNIPYNIAKSLFQELANAQPINNERMKQMTFEDFLVAYMIITSKTPEERAQLCFLIFKIYKTKDDEKEDGIKVTHFKEFVLQYLNLSAEVLEDFLCSNKLCESKASSRITKGINKEYNFKIEQFILLYAQNKNHPIFNWFEKIKENTKSLQNAEFSYEDQSQNVMLSSELSDIKKRKIGGMLASFNHEEQEALQKFFQDKLVKQQEMKAAMDSLHILFEDISLPQKFKNRIIESFLLATENKYFDNRVYMKIMQILIKEDNDIIKTQYIFDIFSKYCSYQHISSLQMKEVIQAFGTQSQFEDKAINLQLNQIGTFQKEEFVHLFKKLSLSLRHFDNLSYIINIEMGIKPKNLEDEKDAIINALNGKTDLTKYIVDNMVEGKQFYILNKRFWDDWRKLVRFDSKYINLSQYFIIEVKQNVQGILAINNDTLKDENSQIKLRDIKYNKDYVLIPKRVWNAFFAWYGPSQVIIKSVIKYPLSDQGFVKKDNDQRQDRNAPSKQEGTYILEVEVDEVLIKFQMLKEDGKKPQSLLEIYVSRKKTFEECKYILCDKLKTANPLISRLWDEDELIDNDYAINTLEIAGIKSGRKFYIEQQLENKRWPSDEKEINKILKRNNIYKKSKGIYNLGNTCYMNSVIQCLANTPFIREYLCGISIQGEEMKEDVPLYKKQINPYNAMGCKGDVINAFGSIVKDVWTCKYSVIPKSFKQTMGKHYEQFRGSQQHDAQEFLVTLLDSLHEETNIRLKKPYIENPSSHKRKEEELMYEYWSNFLMRNWSFFIFVFYGQMRSYIKCMECNTERISYEVFSTLSLPLPDATSVLLYINFIRIPQDIRSILLNSKEELEQKKLNNFELSRKTSMNYDIFEQIFQAHTKERPTLVAISIDINSKVEDIYNKLNQYSDLEIIDKEFDLTRIVFYSQSDSKKRNIQSFHKQTLTIQQLNLKGDKEIIIGQELISEKGKQMIQQFYANHVSYLKDNSRALMQLKTWDQYQSDNDEEGKELLLEDQDQIDGLAQRVPSTHIVEQQIKNEESQINTSQVQEKEQVSLETYFNSNQYDEIKRKSLIERGLIDVAEFVIIAFNRRLQLQKYYIMEPFQPKLFDQPLMVIGHKAITGRELYEEIWMKSRFMLELSNSQNNQDRNVLWWTSEDFESFENCQNEKQYVPFVLKYVKKSGDMCSQCGWDTKCFGCMIKPNSDKLYDTLLRDFYIAIEWNNEFLDENYISHAWHPSDHKSIKIQQQKQLSPVELQDCLKKFSEVEKLNAKDGLFCEKCKNFNPHIKKIDVQNLPPVLIIHLKRFKITAYGKQKINNFVNYPLYDLDMSEFIAVKEAYGEQIKENSTYDLIGVINHYGQMNGGHYVAYVKNEQNNNWYQYDDSSSKDLMESEVRNKSAYILFYKRKDIITKSMRAIYPILNHTNFRGMPVKTKYGDGYLWKYRDEHPCQYIIKLKNNISAIMKQQYLLSDWEYRKEYVFKSDDNEDLTQVLEKYDQEQKDLKNKKNKKRGSGGTTGNNGSGEKDDNEGGMCELF